MNDTITMYKNSTVAVALITYGVSIILIYLADRSGFIRPLLAPIASALKAMKAMIPKKIYGLKERSAKDAGPEAVAV